MGGVGGREHLATQVSCVHQDLETLGEETVSRGFPGKVSLCVELHSEGLRNACTSAGEALFRKTNQTASFVTESCKWQ